MRNSLAILTVIFVSTGLSISLLIANTDQTKPQTTSSDATDNESIDVRYARAHLELAKLDLRRAMEWNKRIPDLLPAATIDKLRRHVMIDEAQLKQYLIGEDTDMHEICVRSAEAAVELAEADLTRRRALHERTPNASSALDVERAGVVTRIAQLNLERMRAQDPSESVLSHLQLQIDELRNQAFDIQLQK